MTDDSPLPKGLEDLRGQVFEERYQISEVCVVARDHVFFGGTALEDEREILLQLFRPAAVSDRTHAERLERRVKATRRIRHPNVICPIDSGERFDGTLYLVSERPAGIHLPRFVAERPQGRLPWELARPLLLDLLRGLGAIHKRRLVHGALRPGGCWVEAKEGSEPRLRLLGLGSNVDPTSSEASPGASGTAPFAGDPSYVAPENILGLLGDALSDTYLVGLVAYFMLVGHPPFFEGSPFQVLASHLKGAVPLVRDRAPDLPGGIDAIVTRLLAKDPADRPANLAEIERQLLSLEVEKFAEPEMLGTDRGSMPSMPREFSQAPAYSPEPEPAYPQQPVIASSQRKPTDVYSARLLESAAALASNAPESERSEAPAAVMHPSSPVTGPTEAIDLSDMDFGPPMASASTPAGMPTVAVSPTSVPQVSVPQANPPPTTSPPASGSSSFALWLVLATLFAVAVGVGVGVLISGS